MNCTDAYHDALTRHFSATAAPVRPRTTAPSQRQAAEAGRTSPGHDDPDSEDNSTPSEGNPMPSEGSPPPTGAGQGL
jgi:hypothetical protein